MACMCGKFSGSSDELHGLYVWEVLRITWWTAWPVCVGSSQDHLVNYMACTCGKFSGSSGGLYGLYVKGVLSITWWTAWPVCEGSSHVLPDSVLPIAVHHT